MVMSFTRVTVDASFRDKDLTKEIEAEARTIVDRVAKHLTKN
jgi:hypothetical protein